MKMCYLRFWLTGNSATGVSVLDSSNISRYDMWTITALLALMPWLVFIAAVVVWVVVGRRCSGSFPHILKKLGNVFFKHLVSVRSDDLSKTLTGILSKTSTKTFPVWWVANRGQLSGLGAYFSIQWDPAYFQCLLFYRKSDESKNRFL